MTVIGYVRVSTDKQDLDKQRHLLLQYAQTHQLLITEFIAIEISSRKDTRARRIDELRAKLQPGDTLLVAELSRLGRNMIETLNLISELSQQGVEIVFVRQPELSTTGPHTKLLLAIYSYFAEAEREFISLRTKQGLAAAQARGQKLGRPKGSRNKERKLDPHRDQIAAFLKLGLSLTAIVKLINPNLDRPLSYNAYKYFIQTDQRLHKLWQTQKETRKSST